METDKENIEGKNEKIFLTKGKQCVTWNASYLNGYSLNKYFQPGNFSILNQQQLLYERLTPPIYFSERDVLEWNLKQENLSSEKLFTIFHRNKHGELVLKDEELLQSQKGILSDLFSQAAKHLIKGKSILRVSLPIRLMDNQTQLQLIAQLFQNTKIITDKSHIRNPLIQIQNIVAYVLSNFVYGVTVKKPFNPTEGETFQGVFEDGSEIYIEHLNHDPSTDAILIVNKEKRLSIYGSSTLIPQLGANEINLKINGILTAKINKETYLFSLPSVQNSGFVFGQRKLLIRGPFFVYNQTSKMKAVIEIGNNQEGISDGLTGGVYVQLEDLNISQKDFLKKMLEKNSDHISTIQGEWTQRIYFDNQLIWKKEEKMQGVQMKYDVLPSDS